MIFRRKMENSSEDGEKERRCERVEVKEEM
jgi:hypothetical protein